MHSFLNDISSIQIIFTIFTEIPHISFGDFINFHPTSPAPNWVATREGNSSHIRTGIMKGLTTPPQRWGYGA